MERVCLAVDEFIKGDSRQAAKNAEKNARRQNLGELGGLARANSNE